MGPENIYLAGFSQGGQMTYHTAFGQLDYTLGGYFTLSSNPMFPVAFRENDGTDVALDWPNYSYNKTGMNWFIFTGEEDWLFNPWKHLREVNRTFNRFPEYRRPNITYSCVAKGVGHEEDSRYFRVMMDFVHNGTVTDIDDYEPIPRRYTRTTHRLMWGAIIVTIVVIIFCIVCCKKKKQIVA